MDLQVKLLRFLQEEEIRPVGGNQDVKVNVRVIAATVRNLLKEVNAGRFREDLYYRLNVLSIELPALRHRGEDIALLIQHFIAKYSEELQKPDMTVSNEAMKCLVSYAWPGNVREMQNEIARVLALYGEQPVLERWMLSDQIFDNVEPDEPMRLSGLSLQEAQEDLERRMIRRGLIRFQGNRSATARALGLSRQGLLKKLKRLDLERVALD